MSHLNVAETIKELLGCEQRTAESIEKQCRFAGIEDVADVKRGPESVYTILKLSTEASGDYYLFLGDGFFLEQIRKESTDGEVIYRAIE